MKPAPDKLDKFNWILLSIGYFAGGYLLINWFSDGRVTYHDVSFPLEKQIPFMPIFIFGYLLVFLSLLLIIILLKKQADWQKALIAFYSATTVAYLFFLILPVRMNERPDLQLQSMQGFSAAVTRFYFIIDKPYNLFPSLHVTYPMLATLISWRSHHIMRWAFLLMTFIVAVSVVLVKQHYIADVIGGIINALICFAFASSLERSLQRKRMLLQDDIR